MNRAKLAGLGLLCVLMTSCVYLGFFAAGTAVGIGGYKYHNGVLTVVYEAPYIDTWKASLTALQEMGLKITKAAHDLSTGIIHAKRADNKSVTIKVEYKSAQQTRVRIRVGIFGDEEASNVIKEKIRRVLSRS